MITIVLVKKKKKKLLFIKYVTKIPLPDWMGVGVISPNCSYDPSWLLAFSNSDLVVTLWQNWALIDVINEDGDGGGGCRAIPPPHQSHRVLSTQSQNVLTLPLKIQHLRGNVTLVPCENRLRLGSFIVVAMAIIQRRWIWELNCQPSVWQISKIKNTGVRRKWQISNLAACSRRLLLFNLNSWVAFPHRDSVSLQSVCSVLPLHIWQCTQLNKGACSSEHTAHFPSGVYISHSWHFKKLFKSL